MERSICETINELREGNTTPTNILNDLIERIGKHDRTIRSYLALDPRAEENASRAESILKNGNNVNPLTGIPVSVKDLIDTEGLATTYGNDYFKHNVPSSNATVVNNILNYGAYVLGKTNTHEFALGMESSPTSNPYDVTRIPGGSSGGSAAAVAAGMALFALGTDTGGSIRIPASMCGITGLKPTYGKVPADGVFPESWSLDHVGPMTRFAKDIPLLMSAMGYNISLPEQGKPVKAAVVREFFDQSDTIVGKTVEKALDKLVDNGIVEIVGIRAGVLAESMARHEVIDTAEIATVHRDLFRENEGIYLETSKEQIRAGLSRTATDYIDAVRQRDLLYSRFEKEMGDARIVLTPALPKVAPTKEEVRKMTLEEHAPYVLFQAPFNYLGMPALSVPCGFAEGLPVGLQVISRRDMDGEAVSIGAEYQKITAWHLRLPEL